MTVATCTFNRWFHFFQPILSFFSTPPKNKSCIAGVSHQGTHLSLSSLLSTVQHCPLVVRRARRSLILPSLIPWAKAMAPHSSTPAWKIPWMEEPGRLKSMGSLRIGHDWATSLSLFTFMHWRRKWQPTPVFLAGESQGRGSLVGCRLWGRKESDTTEAT